MADEFLIDFAPLAKQHLEDLTAYYQRQISDKIKEQLTFEPLRGTKNKKPLVGKEPPWEGKVPFWELRVGEYRVFYDVDKEAHSVLIRAIYQKPPHWTLEEVL